VNLKNIKLMRGLTTVLVCIAILFAFFISGIRIFGLQVYGVLTGSMEPTYPVGSLIYVKKLSANDTLNLQDVITFQMDNRGTIATHRIVELVPDENNPVVMKYRTKGDANDVVDSNLVDRSRILGKVAFCVPGLGNVAEYIQKPPGLYVAILISALMIGFVFYTDSLASKLKNSGNMPQEPVKPLSPLQLKVNEISMKLIKKPLFKAPQAAYNGYSQYQQPYVQPSYPAVQQQAAQQYPQGYQQLQQYGQQYPQGYQQPQQYGQQYPQGYQQPQQYGQQYPQGYQQPQQYGQQYPQGYQQPQQYGQQYSQGYQQPQQYGQQYPQGYQQPQQYGQQYPQGYQQPQQYGQQQYPQQPRRRSGNQ